MRIAYGLQDIGSLLEHTASAFQNLDLIFEAFDYSCIIACAARSVCLQQSVEQEL
jgi:hypothetical protein